MPGVLVPLLTVNRKVPAVSPVGRLATICVLLDDTNVNNAPSRWTTGEPDDGSRFVPVMVICLVVEFMLVLTTVGV
jgi:hypothetical protein